LIFVHGLNPKAAKNHGRQTWTHPNTIFWPGDIIPKLLPKARILLFEYNSQVACSGAADLGIRDHADNLLDYYRAVSPSSKVPIIFVCHSLGGLVVKQALVRAVHRSPDDPCMKDIKTSTYGIVFFGTPHRGGNGVGLGQVVEGIVKTFTGGGSNSLLQSLKKRGQLSVDLQDSFRPYIEDFKYISVIESRPKPGLGIIVSEESATLGADMRRETVIRVDADHSKMCKFDDDAGMFTPIKYHLLRMVGEIQATTMVSYGHESNTPNQNSTQKEEKDQEYIEALLEDETTLHCLASLFSSNQQHRLRQHTSQIAPGTCQWLLSHPIYENWFKSRCSELLLLHGIPGCGKSTLCSFVGSNL